jgi:muramidase (phage lysozyme)
MTRLKALLETIAWAEGAKYNILFGGQTFSDYSTHPNIKVTKGKYVSTAAGKYQILYRTWKASGYTDFTPKTQDLIAINLIARTKALPLLNKGDMKGVFDAISYVWASIPPSRYGQPVKKYQELINVFNSYLAK